MAAETNPRCQTVWGQTWEFLDLVKISHTVFALPFAFISALLAWKLAGDFHWIQVGGIVCCMVTGRAAAMAFNRLLDSTYDKLNPRTALRQIPAGILTKAQVWGFFAVTTVGFIGSAALFLLLNNPWPFFLSFPALALLLGYSYTKRFTSLSHFWLGAALALAPLGAWVAIRGLAWGEVVIPFFISMAVLLWVAGFDILYSCQDIDFDRTQGLWSVPARRGIKRALQLAFICHLGMLVFLLGLRWVLPGMLGWIYLCGVGAAAILILYEHSLVKENDLTRVNRAFFHVNAVISLGLLAVVAAQFYFGI